MSPEPEAQENTNLKPTKTRCEVKRKFDVGNNKKEYRWVLMAVSDIPGRPGDIRCPYCLGPIRLHFKGTGSKVVEDHFEHRAQGDRYNCRAGNGFKGGEHKMSLKPVE